LRFSPATNDFDLFFYQQINRGAFFVYRTKFFLLDDPTATRTRVVFVAGILRLTATSGNPFVRAAPPKIENKFVDFIIKKN